jgi:hypothetical protein
MHVVVGADRRILLRDAHELEARLLKTSVGVCGCSHDRVVT